MSLLWRRRSELHPDQIRAIEGLPPSGKYVLIGPPGSGKTSILLHRGQYLRGLEPSISSIRLVTFSRALREFIATNGDDRFPPGLIQTFRDFIEQIFRAYGEPSPAIEPRVPFSEANIARASAAAELIEQQGTSLEFEALLTDEVQDLTAEEVALIDSLSQRHMFSGDSKQKLYDTSGAFEMLASLDYTTIELRYHFRVSEEICKVADRIGVHGTQHLHARCRYTGPTPTIPAATGGLDRQTQIRRMIASLDVQVDTYNDPSDLIGIIVFRKQDCEIVANALDEHAQFENRYGVFHSGIANRRFDPDWKICVLTLQSCKGLEFRAVHWLFVDEHIQLTREKAYTAVTRAKTSLSVYHQDPLVSFLAGAFPSPRRGLFEDDE